MAFPTIPTAGANTLLFSVNGTATTTHTFPSLTTLDNAPGDLLIAVVVQYGAASTTNTEFSGWGAGFTEFGDSATATTAVAMGCAYKISDGTETGAFTVTSAGTFRSAQCLMSVKGWHGTTPPQVAFSAATTTAAQDPPNLDPSWSAALEDILWIAVAGGGQTSLTGTWDGITSAPASYTGYAESTISGGDVVGACQIAVAFRQLNGTATNPGVFTTDTSPERERAATIAVRPFIPANVAGAATGAAVSSGTAAATVDDPRLTRYWLAAYTGNGTDTDMFRPAGTDAIEWSAIDLRADCTQVAGSAIVAIPDEGFVLKDGIDLGTDLDGLIDPQPISTALGVDVAAVTVRGIVAELLVVTADANDPAKWNPVAEKDGRVEIWLGEKIVDDTKADVIAALDIVAV